MLLKANLKKFYFSPWFYILFVPSLFLAAALYLSSNHMGGFVHKLPIINVFFDCACSDFLRLCGSKHQGSGMEH